MNTKEIIYQLAKGIQTKLSKVQYGQIRKYLNKQGFSEIALYSAVARHLDENEIAVKDFLPELETLLRGCGKNPFFPKVDNGFTFLTGQYHDLRHGDLETGGAKSPEQRGKYLCNICFQIKDAKDRSKRKNYSNCCNTCYLEQARQYSKEQNLKRKKAKAEIKAAQPVPKPAPKADVMEDKIQAMKSEPELGAAVEPIVEAVETITEMTTEAPAPARRRMAPVKKPKVAELVLDQPEKLAKIEEITGDQEATIIQLSCRTPDLHKLLGALSGLM